MKILNWLCYLSLWVSNVTLAATPEGLPLLQPIDPFSISPPKIPDSRRAAGDLPVATNIDVFGTKTETITLDNPKNIYALSISGEAGFLNKSNASVKVILINQSTNKEYLVYESYPNLTNNTSLTVQGVCEESCLLPLISGIKLRIETQEAYMRIRELQYANTPRAGDANAVKLSQNAAKITKLNSQNLGWTAGETSVSALNYEEKKRLFLEPKVPNLQGFEFYKGGIFEIRSTNTTPTAAASSLVEQFDWRNRHGQNWVTSVKDQGQCGSCWAFASTSALEAVTNLYFNQHLDLDLAEQDALSCSGAGNCIYGGLPNKSLDFFKTTGLVNESCFSYQASDLSCGLKCQNPNEIVHVTGRIDFGSVAYPQTEDALKRMIIENGVISGGIISWLHAMALVGYERDNADGRVIWIFKNSWGIYFGESGYARLKLDINDISWTHAIQNPIISSKNYQIQCVDNDQDGFCHWGISATKPATCSASCKERIDCDDSNSNLGSFDSNYRCQAISDLKKTQSFSIFNDGNGELAVSSISAEPVVNWLKVEPNTVTVPAGQSRTIAVTVDYSLVPETAQSTRLKVSSNDPDENPYPNGVTINVAGRSQTNGSTTGTTTNGTTGTTNCLPATVDNSLDIHIPNLKYGELDLWANLRFAPRGDLLLFEVVNHGTNAPTCASATLSSDLKLHISNATFGAMKLWADFSFYPSNDGKLYFLLNQYAPLS
jgi:C1A family cysteine protease